MLNISGPVSPSLLQVDRCPKCLKKLPFLKKLNSAEYSLPLLRGNGHRWKSSRFLHQLRSPSRIAGLRYSGDHLSSREAVNLSKNYSGYLKDNRGLCEKYCSKIIKDNNNGPAFQRWDAPGLLCSSLNFSLRPSTIMISINNSDRLGEMLLRRR